MQGSPGYLDNAVGLQLQTQYVLEAQESKVPVSASGTPAAGNPDNPLILWHSGLQGNKGEKMRNANK